MPYLYEQPKQNFTCAQHFQEVAIKTINEIYGRVKPLDIFDFSENKTHYRAVAYREGEDAVPEEQLPGAPTGDDEVEKARAAEEENKRKADEELAAARARLINVLEQGGELSDEDKALARTLELIDDEGKYTLEQILKASDAAMKLADEAGIDLKLVTGTGANGNITKGDVEKYIAGLDAKEKELQADNAPDEENANDDQDSIE